MSDELSHSQSFTEKLVAYLDGELPEGDAREIEQGLASDPTVRTEVEQLSRVWELLDLLPRPNASSEFSSRTLATLKVTGRTANLTTKPNGNGDVAATVTLTTVSSVSRPASPRTLWMIGLFLVGVVGFLVGRMSAGPANDVLLDELPVIERLDEYREIGNAKFLRDLQRDGVLHEWRPRDAE
jgi:anti-sigma factor RsiW